MSEGFKRKLLTELNMSEEAFLNLHDVDLRYIEGPAYIGPPLRKFADGTDEDIWGVRRRTVEVPTRGGAEIYKEVIESPLASAQTVEDVIGYDHWPSADWFDYSCVEAQCDEVLKQERAVVFMGDRMNRIAQLKPAMYIRGVEQIFMDMSLDPDVAEAIFTKIREFYCAYAERIFDAANGKIDIVLTGDDFGSQNGPLISNNMWVNFLGKGFADYVSLAKNNNALVMHHTCGSVKSLIPCMMERGLDVLQSLQPEAEDMNPRVLKAEFGSRLGFQGGISIQDTMPFGTPQDVRDEIKDRVEALAPGGGYILCTAHNIQADVPVENAMELFRAYKDYDVDPDNHKLVINQAEARVVRSIFKRFEEVGSGQTIAKELNAKGITTKSWTTREGKFRPGKAWDGPAIYRIIANPVYIGQIKHKEKIYPGEHEAIVTQALWDRAHAMIQHDGRVGSRISEKVPALLKGIIRCGHCDHSMYPTYTRRKGKTYRYYLCVQASKAGYDTCPVKTVAAGEIEDAVVGQLRAIFKSPEMIAQTYLATQELILEEQTDGQMSADVTVTELEVAQALRQLGGVWEELFPAERSRIVRSLVEQVSVYENDLDVRIRTGGIHSIISELRRPEEEECLA
jgi:hypothetical protein